MELTTKDIQTIRGYLQTQPVLRAYIVGSYARGKADYESDLDLASRCSGDKSNIQHLAPLINCSQLRPTQPLRLFQYTIQRLVWQGREVAEFYH